MGCGSSVAQVSDSTRQGLFRPVRLLNLQKDNEAGEKQGKMFLFGETRTQRKILEIDFKNCITTQLSKRVRIPVPRVHYDPIQLMYQQSQQIFHLGVYGLSVLPPFNNMMALFLQNNLIFLCGGKDYDSYNIKNEAFFYSINDEKIQNQSDSQLPNNQKTQIRSKYSSNRFQKIAGMGSKRYGHAGIYISTLKSIFVFGGINDKEEVLNTCERYNIFDNSWKEVHSMHVPRAFACCFLYKNKVYVFGGRSNSLKKTKKIQVFDSQAHTWEVLNFKIHRSIENCFTFSKKPNQVYIVGGITQSGKTKSCIKIDLQNRSYIWDSTLNFQYQAVKGMRIENDIVIFGGSKNKFQSYQDGRWILKQIQLAKGYELDEINIFTCSNQSLNVSSEQSSSKQVQGRNNFLLLGNDEYPCILHCDLAAGTISIDSLPMSFKIHSRMSIIEYEEAKYLITGGCDYKCKKTFKSAYLYNSLTQDIRQTVKMSERKCDFAMCTQNGIVYVFGGSDEFSHAKNTCSKFHIENQHWQSLPTLRRARKNCFSQVINSNKIAIFGGENASIPVAGIQLFLINEKKFDIYEPSLEIPNKIISTYTRQNNEDYIYIFNKDEDSNYFLTTISLKEPKQVLSNSKQDIANISTDIQNIEVRQSPQKEKLKTQDQLHIIEKQVQAQQMPLISIKPQMIEIKPKQQESQSSQLQKNDSPPLPDNDLDNSFQMEEINMSKSNIQKIEQTPQRVIIQQKKLTNIEDLEEKQQKIQLHSEQQNQRQSAHNIVPQKLETSSNIQQEDDVPQQKIKTQLLPWLQSKNAFIVADRLQKIYFVTQNLCIQFDKKTEQNHAYCMVNKSKLRLDLIM